MAQQIEFTGSSNDDVRADVVEALVAQGVDDAQALRIAAVVLSHVDEHRSSEGVRLEVAVDSRRRPLSSIGSIVQILRWSTMVLAGIVLSMVVLTLNRDGFEWAAFTIGLATAVVALLQFVRYQSIGRKPAGRSRPSGITIEVHPIGGPAMGSHELKQFANAVGQLTDRRGPHLVG